MFVISRRVSRNIDLTNDAYPIVVKCRVISTSAAKDLTDIRLLEDWDRSFICLHLAYDKKKKKSVDIVMYHWDGIA